MGIRIGRRNGTYAVVGSSTPSPDRFGHDRGQSWGMASADEEAAVVDRAGQEGEPVAPELLLDGHGLG